MKVIIIANCAHRAYYNYLTGTHPDWDVRAVVPVQAKSWIAEGREAFGAFLAEADLFVGFTGVNEIATYVNPSAHKVGLPPFAFRAFMPDLIGVKGFTGVLESGDAHSRIAMAGYLSGLTTQETAQLFNAEHYGQLGYYDQYEDHRAAMLAKAAKCGFDLTEALDCWLKTDRFLYYPVHPNTRFFFDMIHMAMMSSGCPPDISDAAVSDLRNGFDDYLSNGVHWPVYPEIASHFGIEAWPTHWRLSAANNSGQSYNLEQMLEKSFALYKASPDRLDSMLTVLGGASEVARYAAKTL